MSASGRTSRSPAASRSQIAPPRTNAPSATSSCRREQTRTSDRLAAQIARDGVVGVKDGGVPRALVQVNIFLGRDVLRHVAVHVQMVRGEVRQHRDLRRVRHIHQLERRKLQHRKIVRRHLLRVREQRTADVAAEPHAPSLGLEKLGNDARGGGLAVAAGHAENGTRTDGEERLHLARDGRAVRLRLQQLRHVGRIPGVRKTTSASRSRR